MDRPKYYRAIKVPLILYSSTPLPQKTETTSGTSQRCPEEPVNDHSQDQNQRMRVPIVFLPLLPSTIERDLLTWDTAKSFHPHQDRRRKAASMNTVRPRILTGILTGYWTLNKHMHCMGLANSNHCRSCGGVEETLAQLPADCLVPMGRGRAELLWRLD